MSKKGNGKHLGASANRGADTAHHEAHQLGGDGGHVAEMNHANVDHAHVAGHIDADGIQEHRSAHFGMSPEPAKLRSTPKLTKPVKTGKHAKQ